MLFIYFTNCRLFRSPILESSAVNSTYFSSCIEYNVYWPWKCLKARCKMKCYKVTTWKQKLIMLCITIVYKRSAQSKCIEYIENILSEWAENQAYCCVNSGTLWVPKMVAIGTKAKVVVVVVVVHKSGTSAEKRIWWDLIMFLKCGVVKAEYIVEEL